MSQSLILTLGQEAVTLIVLMSLPMILTAMLVGLTVSILQAVTQVQEQSISHLARIAALVLVVLWGGQRGYGELERMFVAVITRIGEARLP